MNRAADLYFTYQFIKRLLTPFKDWEAYKLGIIDKDGKVLRKRNTLKKATELEAWTNTDVLTANIKKLLARLPGGSSFLASAAASYMLMKEGNQIDVENEELIEERLSYYMRLVEDGVATNVVGGGQIAGVGVVNPSIPNQNEPGVKKDKKVLLHAMLRRKQLKNV